MTPRSLLLLLSLVVLGLLAWELRWVLMVLFGAVVLAVALDVPVSWLRRMVRLSRPQALLAVLVVLGLLSWQLAELLLPELLEQLNQLTQLVPALIARLAELLGGVSVLDGLGSQLSELITIEKLQPIGAQLLGFAGGAASGTVHNLPLIAVAFVDGQDTSTFATLAEDP